MIEPRKRERARKTGRGVRDDQHETDRSADDRAGPIRAGVFARAVQVDGSLQRAMPGEMFLGRRANALERPTVWPQRRIGQFPEIGDSC
jgi:hypothetical protein